jgi:hypothetical protein
MGEMSPKIPCSECGDRARKRFNGKLYCSDCFDDLVPLDFKG